MYTDRVGAYLVELLGPCLGPWGAGEEGPHYRMWERREVQCRVQLGPQEQQVQQGPLVEQRSLMIGLVFEPARLLDQYYHC